MIKVNSKEIIFEKFPNNETKVKDFDEYVLPSNNLIELKYTDDTSLLKLWFVKKRIDELSPSCTLAIYYMPYSRMDRKIEGDLFTLKYTCNFINTLAFSRVLVVEPHSQVTLTLLERSSAIYPIKDWLPFIMKELSFSANDCIVFPDKGAAARYENSSYPNLCIFEKKRDPQTGKIMDMTLKEGSVKQGAKCIIIDDLCSAGGTFAWAGSLLQSMGAVEVVLAVAHCEPTVFKGKLLADDSPISRIYTSTSIMSQEHPKIQYMHLNISCYV